MFQLSKKEEEKKQKKKKDYLKKISHDLKRELRARALQKDYKITIFVDIVSN